MLVCGLLMLLLAAMSFAQSTLYVKSDAAGSNNGSSWANAYTSLQTALDLAVSGDEIWVAAGTYYPSEEVGGTGNRYQAFQMIDSVGIYGGFAGTETSVSERTDFRYGESNETILSGDIGTIGYNADNCYHVFFHPDGYSLDNIAVLDGFTITKGFADGTDDDVKGAGMYNGTDASPLLRSCNFISNEADAVGGGMYCNMGSPQVISCRFSLNSSYNGGALYLESSTAELINCLVDANYAPTNGGGITLTSSNVTLTNCTITNNTGDNYGGGVNVAGDTNANFNNSIIWGNESANGKDILYNLNWGSTELIMNYCCYGEAVAYIQNHGTFTATNNNITSDPQFVGTGDHPNLIYGVSPCVDAGYDVYCSEAYDIRGSNYPRKLDGSTPNTVGGIDMGAYEFNVSVDADEEAPTPITLTSFSGNNLNGKIVLNWQSTSETENLAYRIYRDDELIAELEGAGTTTEPQDYSYTDQAVIPGQTYTYVLADVTIGNKEVKHIDKAVTVAAGEGNLGKDFNIGASYPNPFNPNCILPLNLGVAADVNISIYNIKGSLVKDVVNGNLTAGSHDVTVSGSDLSTGIYFVRTQINDKMHVQRILLMK